MYVSKDEFYLRQMLSVYTELKDYRKMCETLIELIPDCKDEIIKVAEDRGLVYVQRIGFLEPDEYKNIVCLV